MQSPAEWPTDAPCTDCGRRTPGLLIGNRCNQCTVERRRRASRIAGRYALMAALGAAAWLAWRPLPGGSTGRVWSAVAVALVYLIVRKIVSVVAGQVG